MPALHYFRCLGRGWFHLRQILYWRLRARPPFIGRRQDHDREAVNEIFFSDRDRRDDASALGCCDHNSGTDRAGPDN